MENKDLLRFFLERGVLLDKEVLNLLSDIGDLEAVKAVVEKIRISTNKKIITKIVRFNFSYILKLFLFYFAILVHDTFFTKFIFF